MVRSAAMYTISTPKPLMPGRFPTPERNISVTWPVKESQYIGRIHDEISPTPTAAVIGYVAQDLKKLPEPSRTKISLSKNFRTRILIVISGFSAASLWYNKGKRIKKMIFDFLLLRFLQL